MLSQALEIVKKETLANQVYLIDFKTSEPIEYQPGQFIVMQLGPRIFRSYSIAGSHDDIITFLIDTKVGGEGSNFFEASKVGDKVNFVGKVAGSFTLKPGPKRKVFIATGTGLAPFIPMIKTASKNHKDITLYFGSRHAADDYSKQVFTDLPDLNIISCITRDETVPKNCEKGRVTEIVPKMESDFSSENVEFYLCGNPRMVEEMEKVLQENGATDNIYHEKYGA